MSAFFLSAAWNSPIYTCWREMLHNFHRKFERRIVRVFCTSPRKSYSDYNNLDKSDRHFFLPKACLPFEHPAHAKRMIISSWATVPCPRRRGASPSRVVPEAAGPRSACDCCTSGRARATVPLWRSSCRCASFAAALSWIIWRANCSQERLRWATRSPRCGAPYIWWRTACSSSWTVTTSASAAGRHSATRPICWRDDYFRTPGS